MKTTGDCQFCGKKGEFIPCNCYYANELECGGKPACSDCRNAHGKIGKFVRTLLKTQRADRANSVRAKMFGILVNVVAWHGPEMPQRGFAIDNLRATSSFDANERRFRSSVVNVFRVLPLTKSTADHLRKLTNEFVEEYTYQQIAAKIAEETAPPSQLGLALDAFLQQLTDVDAVARGIERATR